MEGSEARQLRLLVIRGSDRARKDTEWWEIACRDCMSIEWTYSSLMKPCSVRLLHRVHLLNLLPHAHACKRGKVMKFVILSFIHSQKNFEITWSSPFEAFRPHHKLWRYSLSYCFLPATGLIRLHSVIPAIFLLSGPLRQPFTATSHAYK